VAERNAEPVAHVSATLCGAVRSGARQLGELVTLVIIGGACVSACSLAIGCCRARAGLDRPNAVLGILGSAFMPLGGQRQSVTQSVTRQVIVDAGRLPDLALLRERFGPSPASVPVKSSQRPRRYRRRAGGCSCRDRG
jgi:hypothetical protein